METKLQQTLQALADLGYRDFSAGLVPGAELIGVRLPVLRRLAAQIAREDPEAFLRTQTPARYLEETMLRGMVIGAMRTELPRRLALIRDFIPHIDNWSVCDSFCASLKFTMRCKEKVWNFLQPYFTADNPFAVRFAVVMSLDYFLDDDSINLVLERLRAVRSTHYYVQMAMAWCLSVAVVKQPDTTLPLLRPGVWDEGVFRRAIQKCCESYRVPDSVKNALRQVRKNTKETG